MNIRYLVNKIEPVLPPVMKLCLQYYRIYHRVPNFIAPKTYTEKLYYRMINPLPVFSTIADKVEVRKYVEASLGPEYLIPVYGIYEKISAHDLNVLPESFVLKANHGAGYNIIVKDKKKVSLGQIAKEANDFLQKDYSELYHEKHYKNITPRLIAEKALLKGGKSPCDYKIHVFNSDEESEPFIFIQLMDRDQNEIYHYFLLEDWSPAPFGFVKQGVDHITNPELLRKPKLFKELLSAAKKLAKPFSYARIDFYVFENKVYFGEITLTPGGGHVQLKPDGWDEILGEKFSWPDGFSKDLQYDYLQ